MNHHLRFVSPAVLAAGAILSATSCSSTKVEPLTANPKHEITYEIRIYDLQPGHDFGDKASEVVTTVEGDKLIRRLDREPSFFATTGGRIGQKKTVTNKKEFVYPTEYSPAVFKKSTDLSIFPATPATPTAFDKTRIGTTVSLSSSHDSLSVNLDRKAFLGFLNYGTPITTDATDFFGRTVQIIITENRIEKPIFRRDLKTASAKLAEGEFLVIRNPEAETVVPGKLPFAEKRPPGFIAMIRETRR